MLITLLRHGKTQGNLEGQYLGSTDQSLCQYGIEELKYLKNKNIYPSCHLLASSPLLRCRETASIIYPEYTKEDIYILPLLKEIDFGKFEGKSYTDLQNTSEYQEWLNSGGESTFPNGESKTEFCNRCREGFEGFLAEIVNKKCLNKQNDENQVTIITHGGVIMALMEAFFSAKKTFYDYQVKNGEGYQLFFQKSVWTNSSICCIVKKIEGWCIY